MKPFLFQFFVFVFISNVCFSQIQSGQVIYKVKNNQEVMDQIRAKEKKNSDNFFTKQFNNIQQLLPYLTFSLTFDKTESHFSKLKQMRKDNGPDLKLALALMGVRGDYYSNLEKGKTLQQFYYIDRDWSVAHAISDYNWQIGSETKTIQGYTCHKATSDFHPISARKHITVWFTSDIPFQFGPLNYCGLPGLVLQADQGFYTFYATDVHLSKKTTKIDQPLHEPKEMTVKEFRKKSKALETRMKRHHSGQ